MSKILITTVSWEGRYQLSLNRLIENNKPDQIYAIYFDQYDTITSSHRLETKSLCERKGIQLKWLKLSYSNPPESWLRTYEFLIQIPREPHSLIHVDISTMPREKIWTVFNILLSQGHDVRFTYSKPESYNSDWLSQEPGKPRIVYKMGGISKLNEPNILLIQTGYDIDRIEQIINSFNPEKSFLAIQTGSQFENDSKNTNKCKNHFKNHPNISTFEVDAYSDDYGLNKYEEIIKPYIESHNILATSVGPKLGAVALFRLYLKYNTRGVGLIYAPSEKFNLDYSHGIGRSYTGSIQ